MPRKKLEPFIYRNVTVTRVVDGDTVACMVDLGFKSRFEDNFRLVGIDTPERGQPGFYEATSRLEFLLKAEDNKVELETLRRDKYGRWLADIRSLQTGASFNQQMLHEGYAKAYDGGKR